MTPAAQTVNQRSATPLWRNLNFQLMWTSVAASGFGDRMIELAAMPLLGVIAVRPEAADKIAAVYFWYFLPWIFITPVGGWLADTLPRQWILLACDESRALILLAACLMVPAGIATGSLDPGLMRALEPHHGRVYLVLALVGAFACIFSATRNALIPQLVPSGQLGPANGIVLGIGVVASLIGYLGGKVMERDSIRMGIEVACGAFAVSGLFFAFMRPRLRTGMETDRLLGQWTRMRHAAAYIHRHRPIRDLVLLNALVWSMAMVVAPAIGSLCYINYGIQGEHWLWSFSKLNMGLGIGMMASALLISFMNVRREAPIVILLGLLTVSLWLVLLACNRSYPLGLVLAFLIGVSGGIAMIGVATLTQAICPNYILGRVTGLREVLSNFASVAVNLVIWQLPWLRAMNPRVPQADPILIFLLYPLAVVLALVALRGLWMRTSRGPMDTALANILWRLCRLYSTVWHRLRWIGAQHIPRQGPIILASNHTTGLDPTLIQAALARKVTWVMLTSYRFRGLGFLWRTLRPITLNPAGGDVAGVREIVHRLKADEAVGLFPEGGLQRTERQLQALAPGIAMVAVRGHAAIVPVWIDGTPRHQYMLWHFLFPSRSTVVFGKPYMPDPALSYQEITDDLRRRMLELSQQVGG